MMKITLFAVALLASSPAMAQSFGARMVGQVQANAPLPNYSGITTQPIEQLPVAIGGGNYQTSQGQIINMGGGAYMMPDGMPVNTIANDEQVYLPYR